MPVKVTKFLKKACGKLGLIVALDFARNLAIYRNNRYMRMRTVTVLWQMNDLQAKSACCHASRDVANDYVSCPDVRLKGF